MSTNGCTCIDVAYPKERIPTIWDYGGMMQDTLKNANNDYWIKEIIKIQLKQFQEFKIQLKDS